MRLTEAIRLIRERLHNTEFYARDDYSIGVAEGLRQALEILLQVENRGIEP